MQLQELGFDPYDVLGVSRKASPQEIKRRYRRLARMLHPDTGRGNEAKFQLVAYAYEILSDSDTRREYDEYYEWLQAEAERQRFEALERELEEIERRRQAEARSPANTHSAQPEKYEQSVGDQKTESLIKYAAIVFLVVAVVFAALSSWFYVTFWP